MGAPPLFHGQVTAKKKTQLTLGASSAVMRWIVLRSVRLNDQEETPKSQKKAKMQEIKLL